MKIEVTDEEINILLKQFLEKIKKIDPFLYPIFTMMYSFGFRAGEVIELKRWKMINEIYFEVETEKKSHKRKINVNLIPQEYLRILSSYPKTENYCSYDKLKNRFQVYFSKVIYYSEYKKICTHLFRHNYVKTWSKEGEDIKKIADRIGEVDERNIEIYRDSKFYLMSLDEIKKKHFEPQKPLPIKINPFKT